MQSNTSFSKIFEVDRNYSDSNIIFKDIPFVIKDGAKNWPAFQKWTLQYLLENAPDISVSVRNLQSDGRSGGLSLQKFLSMQMLDDSNAEDLYLAGWDYQKNWPSLREDVRIPAVFEENFIHSFQKVMKFPTTTMFVGKGGTNSKAHTDFLMVGTYLAQLKGQKRIRICDSFDDPYTSQGKDLFDDDLAHDLVSRGCPVIDLTLEEGDIIFFPPGWWHQIINLGFSLAVATNHVSKANLLVFEQQLRAKVLRPFQNLYSIRSKEQFHLSPDHSTTSKIKDYAYFDQNEREYKKSILQMIQERGYLLSSLKSKEFGT